MDPQTGCRLLSLAPELRNKIYYDLFYMSTLEKPIRLLMVQFEDVRGRPLTVLSLLQTCRQIRCEAEGIFFAVNHIAITWLFVINPRPVDPISAIRLESIRTLTVEACPRSVEMFVKRRLDQMTGLSVLTFDGECQFSPKEV